MRVQIVVIVAAAAMFVGCGGGGSSNSCPQCSTTLPSAATPTLSLPSGSYGSAQTVTISDTTSGATIYYTTDGTPPTTASTPYTGPIMVNSTETVEAIATASGYSSSAVATATYTITAPAVTLNTPAPGASQLSGYAYNFAPGDAIVIYVLTNEWYVQPYTDAPFTSISADGSWTSFTNPWQSIVVLLVNPASYTPAATKITNPALDSGVIAWTTYPPGPISLSFSGHTWGIKTTGTAQSDQFDPGPNFFTNDPSVVSVAADGSLHLKINQINGQWQCGEVYLLESLGYGTYTVQVGSPLNSLDQNTVAAPLFIYAGTNQELDVEYSGIGGLIPSPDNAQFVTQPYTVPGNLVRFVQPSATQFTVQMEWQADQVTFVAWNGWSSAPAASDIINQWTYTGSYIPPVGQERVHINLWLFNGSAPISGSGDEMVIHSFVFQQPSTTEAPPPPAPPAKGEWTWKSGSDAQGQAGAYGTLGMPAAGNVPGGRQGASSWTDGGGNLWLFGGNANFPATPAYLNDLWEFKPSAATWTWVAGSNSVNRPGVYGTMGAPAAGNVPGGRFGAGSWTDAKGDGWLFGGRGLDSGNIEGLLDDLWEFNASTKEWTWMGGSSRQGQRGVYGTLGTPSAGNVPGARESANIWTDSSGNFWLFAGLGVDSTGFNGFLNDLWEFSASTNEWTWMGGSSTIGSTGARPGVYGTLGTPAAANVPGGRYGASSWTDSSGNLWLFGGMGPDSSGLPGAGDLNDLWEFSPSTGKWTWMAGSSKQGQRGTYGTLGAPAAGNAPGARYGASSWTDGTGNLWLLGGLGLDSMGSSGFLDDLWTFSLSTGQWTWMGGGSVQGEPGAYGRLGTAAPGNSPGGRYAANNWTDSSGNFWLFGGWGLDETHSLGDLNDLWVLSF